MSIPGFLVTIKPTCGIEQMCVKGFKLNSCSSGQRGSHGQIPTWPRFLQKGSIVCVLKRQTTISSWLPLVLLTHTAMKVSTETGIPREAGCGRDGFCHCYLTRGLIVILISTTTVTASGQESVTAKVVCFYLQNRMFERGVQRRPCVVVWEPLPSSRKSGNQETMEDRARW